MEAYLPHVLRFARDQDDVCVEACADLAARFCLAAPLSRDTVDGLVGIYNKVTSDLSPIQYSLLAEQNPLRNWLAAAFEDDPPLPDNELQRQRIIKLAVRRQHGAEDICDILHAWSKLPGTYRGDDLLGRATEYQVRHYLDYLREFGRYVAEDTLRLAIRLLLTSVEEATADQVCWFVDRLRPSYVSKIRTINEKRSADEQLRVTDRHWSAWFRVYRRHQLREEGLPQEYLDTPFTEVIRNAPAQAWLDLSEGPDRWPFSMGRAGFYHLAAGEKCRDFLRANGLQPLTWRGYCNLNPAFELRVMARPREFVWALGLGASEALAREVTHFLRPAYRDRWAPVIRRLAQLSGIDWEAEVGQRVLGYLYHMLRDQPNFSLRGRRAGHLLNASRTYYENVARTQEGIRQARRAQITELPAEPRQLRRNMTDEDWRQLRWPRLAGIRAVPFPRGSLQIVELTNAYELRQEGLRMNNCVASYLEFCYHRRDCHLFSLRSVPHNAPPRSIVTIDVNPQKRAVQQALARFNRIPDRAFRELIRVWARRNELSLDVDCFDEV